MTNQEIRDAIAADPALQAMQAAGNYAGIAAALPPDTVIVRETYVGVGLIMGALGPALGADVLDSLDAIKESNNSVKWAWVLLNAGTLYIGDAGTRAMVQALADQGAFTAAATAHGTTPQAIADALLAIGERREDLTAHRISSAIYNDDGSLAV